jgi:hypothetical protein
MMGQLRYFLQIMYIKDNLHFIWDTTEYWPHMLATVISLFFVLFLAVLHHLVLFDYSNVKGLSQLPLAEMASFVVSVTFCL